MGELVPLGDGPPGTFLYLLPVGEGGGVRGLRAQNQGADDLR